MGTGSTHGGVRSRGRRVVSSSYRLIKTRQHTYSSVRNQVRLFMKLPNFPVFSCSLFHLVELDVMGYLLGEKPQTLACNA